MLLIITSLLISLHPVADTGQIPIEQLGCVLDPMPIFPGGDAALRQYLETNIKYPKDAIARKAEGKVVIQFKVDKQGRLYDLKRISSPIDTSLEKEAFRAMKAMPKWKYTAVPGKDSPPYTMRLPFVFSLPPEEITVLRPNEPYFRGNMDAYIQRNIRYPADALAAKTQDTVLLKVLLDRQGCVKKATVIRTSKLPSLEKEAIRVVQQMPAWRPAYQGIGGAAYYVEVPVRFVLPVKNR